MFIKRFLLFTFFCSLAVFQSLLSMEQLSLEKHNALFANFMRNMEEFRERQKLCIGLKLDICKVLTILHATGQMTHEIKEINPAAIDWKSISEGMIMPEDLVKTTKEIAYIPSASSETFDSFPGLDNLGSMYEDEYPSEDKKSRISIAKKGTIKKQRNNGRKKKNRSQLPEEAMQFTFNYKLPTQDKKK